LDSGNWQPILWHLAHGNVSGSEKFVAVGDSGKMAYSSDGTTWAVGTNSPSGNNINAIAYGDGKFVVVGNSGKTAYDNAEE
jgi:hypothetical protein